MSGIGLEYITELLIRPYEDPDAFWEKKWKYSYEQSINLMKESYDAMIDKLAEEAAPLSGQMLEVYDQLLDLTIVSEPFKQNKRRENALIFMNYPEFNRLAHTTINTETGKYGKVIVEYHPSKWLTDEAMTEFKKLYRKDKVNIYMIRNPSRRVLGGHMLKHVMSELSAGKSDRYPAQRTSIRQTIMDYSEYKERTRPEQGFVLSLWSAPSGWLYGKEVPNSLIETLLNIQKKMLLSGKSDILFNN